MTDKYAPQAERWTETAYADPGGYLAHRAELVVSLGPRLEPGGRVLDLACGDGGLAAFLPAEYLGIDASPEMVAAARLRGVAAELADLNEYEPPEPVAATTCFRAIYYASDRRAFFQLVRTRMQQPCRDQNREANQRWNEQHTESGPKTSVIIKNQRHEQRTDRRAGLIERFVQAEYPSGANRFTGVRKHCFHSRLADTSPGPLCYHECGSEWPSRCKCKGGNREHVNGVPHERERPMPMRFVREITRDRAQPVAHQLAQTCDKADDRRARA